MPGKVRAGAVSGADIASIDWLPTVAAFAGLSLHPATAAQLRGRDATPLFVSSGRAAAPRTHPLAWDYRFSMPGKCYHMSPRLAILDPDTGLKLLMHPDRSRVELYVVLSDTAKPVLHVERITIVIWYIPSFPGLALRQTSHASAYHVRVNSLSAPPSV